MKNVPRNYEPVKKLICDQNDENYYLCHYRNQKIWDIMVMEVTILKKGMI